MTKDELIKQIKGLAYNNKGLTKKDLIHSLEEILRETGESILNDYEYSTPKDERRTRAMDRQMAIEAGLEEEE